MSKSKHKTHIVQKGDTLKSLSKKFYNTDEYYIHIANYNGLDKFRNLNGGDTLIFPPLIEFQ